MRKQKINFGNSLLIAYFSQVLDDAEDDDGCLEDEASLNERRLVSRYGVWLLVGLCTPEPDTPMSTFGHMLSMLFQVK